MAVKVPKKPRVESEQPKKTNFFNDETMEEVNDVVNQDWEVPTSAPVMEVKEERVVPVPVVEEPKKKGRPKKGATLELTVGINVFLDKPLHKKLQYARAETDISIKDLIYMATDYMMNELFDGSMPTKEGERVIREFKEKMFGAED
jgi:hypothetical protein